MPLQRKHLTFPLLLLALMPGLARAFDPTPVPTRRPQEPKRPFPYTAEEVIYPVNDGSGVKIAGTLTIPQGPGPFPAVLLISGSGPQDRDGALYGHQPLLVIADHLSRHGIAVLRADDRGVGGSTGNVDEATTADFARDALAGVRFLASHPRIARDRIGLLGHSEGGVVAPLAASQSPGVAFLVLLAGTGVPGAEIVRRQGELIARANGVPEEAIQRSQEALRRTFEVLRAVPDRAARTASLRPLGKDLLVTLSEDQIKTLGGLGAAGDAVIKGINTPWFRYFIDYDPRPALRKVKVPVLALNGTLDLQVPPDPNLPEIAKALKQAGNRDVTVRLLPGLNHLFQPATTGSPAEYGVIETTIDPQVLGLVTDWITKRFAR
jgi:pimeloyl-ACP methyl ester carboxylesterase